MVRVVSCRYMRISCSEDDHPLFRRYYARSNRERGVKLLRCFPHCCPEHIQMCYCGCSIHVLVTFAAELSAVSRGNLVVCARFEPSRKVPLWPANLVNTPGLEDGEDDENQRKLQPGEVVSLPTSLLSKDKRQTRQTIWIRADREADVKQKYQSGVLFVLKNHRFPKWLYSYDSSVNRTQREMTHHLVVYVCQLTGTSSQPSEIDATVLARHESPGFSLISYRRSGNSGSDAGCNLPAIDVSSSSAFAAVEVDLPDTVASTSDDVEMDAVGQSRLSNQSFLELETKRSYVIEPQQCSVPPHKQHQDHLQQEMECHVETRRPEAPVSCSSFPQDKSSWQLGPVARGCDFREKVKHLLILWRVFRSVLVSDLGLWPDAVDSHVRSHWLRTASCLRVPTPHPRRQLTRVVESFLTQLFTTPSIPPESTSTRASTARNSPIIRVTVHLFLRALLSDAVQSRIISVSSIQNGASGKSHLQEQFVLLVSDLYDTFGDLLHQMSAQMHYSPVGSQVASLPALVDDVISLVCSYERFRELRAGVLTLLMGQRPVGSLSDAVNDVFQTFTALAREAMIASVSQHRDATRQQFCAASLRGEDFVWNQRWLLEPGSVQIADVTSSNPRNGLPEMALVDVAQLVYELGSVDIAVEDNGSSLSVRSSLSLTSDTKAAPTMFVLDGRLRVFRVMPAGTSSMIQTAGGWSVGDYKAKLSEDRRVLTVNLFSFAEDADSGTVQLRWINLSIRIEEELAAGDAMMELADQKDLFAFVHGAMYGSTYSPSPSEIATGFKLSASKTSDRAAKWSGVEWTPLCEVRAGYIALPRMGFV